MAASTLLTDAFEQAVAYWRANNGGTRAGLIAHLQATVSISQATAANWVDAMTAEAFNIAMTDGTTYADFKARLLAVGPTRALNGARCVFDHLRDGALAQDSRNETIALKDEQVVLLEQVIAETQAVLTDLQSQPAGTTRDVSLAAVGVRLAQLQAKRLRLLSERTSLASQ